MPHLQPAQTCCTILTTCLRNKHLCKTDGEIKEQSNSGLTESVEGANYESSMPCSCLYTLNGPQMWDASCVQRALKTKIFSLALPGPQEIIPFPQIL